ncbi:hypothetical protein KA005_27660 [bacterium]|nr:hypothetical protein [bacterium]
MKVNGGKMSKCEWIKGKVINSKGDHRLIFKPCDSFDGHVSWEQGSLRSGTFCKHCQANIVKPEPEKPLIVKDGDTWAKYEKGKNYLCINPYNYNNGFKNSDNWRPFSEIEKEGLTDEIAKLRVMVIDGNSKEILVGIIGEIIITFAEDQHYDAILDGQYRLATPKELNHE